MDFAGVVEAAPADPQYRFRKGDRVYGSVFGAFAEWIAIDAYGPLAKGVRLVPRTWSGAEACAVGASGAISLGAFYRVGQTSALAGQWCLVTGATGGLGVIAVQVARALGMKVVALSGGEEKSAMLTRIGVDAVVDYREKGWEKKVLEVSGGVSVVYDAVGMVEESLRCCGFAGTVVVVGFAGRGGKMEKLQVNRILLKGAGVVGYRFGEHGRRDPAAAAQIWADFDAMVESGAIRPVVYHQSYHGLDDIRRALEDMEQHKTWGRAVVNMPDQQTAAKL